MNKKIPKMLEQLQHLFAVRGFATLPARQVAAIERLTVFKAGEREASFVAPSADVLL